MDKEKAITRKMIDAGVRGLLGSSVDIRKSNWDGLCGNDELEAIVI